MTVSGVEVGIWPKPAFRPLFKIATARVEKEAVSVTSKQRPPA